MKEIDEKSTSMLLAVLDKEIDAKCVELKEYRRKEKSKKVFFFSCFFILLSFLMQVFLNIFNVNLLITFFTYQGLALIFTAPLVLNISRREYSK